MTTNLTFPQQRKKKYDFPWWEWVYCGLSVEFALNKVSTKKANKVNFSDKGDDDVWMVGLGNFI